MLKLCEYSLTFSTNTSLKLATELVHCKLSTVQLSKVKKPVELKEVSSQHCNECEDQLAGCQDGRTQRRWMMLTIWRVLHGAVKSVSVVRRRSSLEE